MVNVKGVAAFSIDLSVHPLRTGTVPPALAIRLCLAALAFSLSVSSVCPGRIRALTPCPFDLPEEGAKI